ncbi:MAG: hypothetical protein HY908_29700 [Myxococcales bacterium]|nr:hypothetical protein [Myxococcales bacterium]
MRLGSLLAYASLPVLAAGIYAAGCNAGGKSSKLNQVAAGAGGEGNVGTGGAGNQNPGGAGGTIFTTSSNTGGSGGMIINPCGTGCGPDELCDTDHLGTDDDCNGLVDDNCPCQAGLTHWCFEGDPSFLGQQGCYPGTQSCTEFGTWGECIGGVGADVCADPNNQLGCHAITTPPFVTVDLKPGTGNFSAGALTESWSVACPPGVSPCPAVGGSNPADDFQPIVSGEYTVTYTKTTANGPEQCSYPLFVGAPGLRVELDWEHDLGGSGVDLDLHVHQPGTTAAWTGDGGNPSVCAWDNCKYYDFQPPFPMGPDWFNGVAPPDPVDWYLDPDINKNSCYFAPRGVGASWQAMGLGCHNPRLDLDNITCDPSVVDPQNSSFCAPENINIDYPPNNEWTRVGVHYYSNHSVNYSVHPRIRIFCNGQMAADLGPAGYDAPVTFTPAMGTSPSSNTFWLVADVRFSEGGQCATQSCEVVPIFQDPNAHTPRLPTVPTVQGSWSPPYPP